MWLQGSAESFDFSEWRAELDMQKLKWPMKFPKLDNNVIVPQHAIQVLHELTGGNAIISTGVGQHQMWAAQWFGYEEPRRWLTSGGKVPHGLKEIIVETFGIQIYQQSSTHLIFLPYQHYFCILQGLVLWDLDCQLPLVQQLHDQISLLLTLMEMEALS